MGAGGVGPCRRLTTFGSKRPAQAPTAARVRFTDTGGLFELVPSTYSGQIYNFGQGDEIVLAATQAGAASYDADTGILSATDNGTLVAFDAHPGSGAADPANADGLAGYLPFNPETGQQTVTVLGKDSSHGSDEGRAIAELIHQVAPGAQLFFHSGAGSLDDFAAAVSSLQDAGCRIIVDDLFVPAEPFFQDTGSLNAAIEHAIASGVSYFSEAGNQDGRSYQAPYNPHSVTLYDQSSPHFSYWRIA